jgi:hypothetical protein
MKPLLKPSSAVVVFHVLFLLCISNVLFAISREDSTETAVFAGPFQNLFDLEGCLFIYPSGSGDKDNPGTEIQLLNKWAEYCRDPEIVSDSSALSMDLTNRNVFTTGNTLINDWLRHNREHLRFTVTDTAIITDRIYPGKNMLLSLCQPNPYNPEKGWFFLSGQSPESYELLNASDFWFILKDWSILDSDGMAGVNDFNKDGGIWAYDKTDTDLQDSARWIWYPGDFEIELNRRTALMRKERNEIYPPLWTVEAPYGSVIFQKMITISKTDTLSFYADGEFTITRGPLIRFHDYDPENLILEPGVYYIMVNVINYGGLPALLVKGRSVVSDTSWRASLGVRGEELVPGSWDFRDPEHPPACFRLAEKEIRPVSVVRTDTSIFADFGQETFGRLILENVDGEGKILVVYGESKEEAAAGKLAETWEIRDMNNEQAGNDTLPVPMAFRYVNLIPDGDLRIGNVSHLYEYLPLKRISSFESSDELLNRIFEASSRTLILNTREVFFDGIKRDRWCWSGDVFIALPCAYYHYFDEDVVRRSLIALRGHDYVGHHINTIPDWTFYWFINMYNHYLFTGDSLLIKHMFSKMKGLMEYCLDSRDERGFFSFKDQDWSFVDWSDIHFEKVQSFEQLLLLRSLEIMAYFSEMLDKHKDNKMYAALADDLRAKIWKVFWKDEVKGFIHHEVDSGDYTVTRYSNIYAILFDFLDEQASGGIKENIILNDTIPGVGTPFHKSYELDALCEAGEHLHAIREMKDYWGGMLDLGATTFWERYDPEQTGLQHYTHSRRPFGRSLCHIWAAGPIYILSRHIAGLKPLEPGYTSYLVEPNLCGLEWFNTEMPVKGGRVKISMDQSEIQIQSDISGGICRFKSKRKPESNVGQVQEIGKQIYEINLNKDQLYTIRYSH